MQYFENLLYASCFLAFVAFALACYRAGMNKGAEGKLNPKQASDAMSPANTENNLNNDTF